VRNEHWLVRPVAAHFNTGQNISPSRMSYVVNAKQYVAIAAGNDVFSFAFALICSWPGF
jgi:hypothetical protein